MKSNPELRQKSRDLRKTDNPFEIKLWNVIRNRQLGHYFRRQHPIPPYFVDFVCLSKKLIIEIDGISHDGRIAYDKQRDDYLKHLGFTVIRFTNEDVGKNIEGVIESVRLRLNEPD